MDKARIEKYLAQICAEGTDIGEALQRPDDEILSSPREMKSQRYSVIVISEAMAGVLQHILAKKHNVAVSGYTEIFLRAGQQKIVSEELANRLQPFIRFRNMLVLSTGGLMKRGFWAISEAG